MGMNIDLPPQLEEMVHERVSSGVYSSASEVAGAALRLLEEQDQLHLAKLRQAIQDGLDSGPAIPWDPEEVKRAARASRIAKPGSAA